MADLGMTLSASEAIDRGREIAREHSHPQILPLHLLFSLLVPEEGAATRILLGLGREVGPFRGLVEDALSELPRSTSAVFDPAPSPAFKSVLELAETEKEMLEDRQVDEVHLLIALMSPDGGLPEPLRKALQLRRAKVLEVLRKTKQAEAVAGGGGATGVAAGQAIGFCADLTAKARAGILDPVIGREREIQQTIEVLARRRKNNAVLVGEPGVGKTAVAEGLAQAIVAGTVPAFLRSARILELDLPAMVAGAKYKGEFEERFKKLLTEMEAAGSEAVLFVDEIHTLLGAGGGGGGIDAANILKPALARGELRVIGATTTGEYRKHFEADAAFARRFVPIQIEEPDKATSMRILEGLRERYEKHHGVAFTTEAFDSSINLSKRYITDRYLPDKAVDLLDEAASDVRILVDSLTEARELIEKRDDPAVKARLDLLRNGLEERGLIPRRAEGGTEGGPKAWLASAGTIAKTVDAGVIARRVSIRTGIPVHRMLGDEREKLLKIEETLNSRVVGQEEAVRAVADAVRRGRAGLKRSNLPIGAFMLLGPTGTGKTFLAKSLALFLFNDEKAMVRIDMSEYKGEHTVSRLIGPPPGYVGYEAGGALTNSVLRRPYSVVLFDEVEKAHPQVLDPLLQVLDDGRLTDGQSRTVDFSNTVVMLTTNLAGSWISEQDSQGLPVDQKVLRDMLIRMGLRPELINRFESLLVFHQFTKEQVARIVDLQLRDVEAILAEQKMSLSVTPAAREVLANEGFDPEMGARPVRRVIDQKIMNPLASLIVGESSVEGRSVRVDAPSGAIQVRIE
ncbi:MAG: ATP-dependent Clp protease ATP-binding subunit [Candidatus Eisenbacteria bacterium]|nr:ATP-dependent Clp protease ATP-binding subunit [Candidatus Eisenbacteria bacterium]